MLSPVRPTLGFVSFTAFCLALGIFGCASKNGEPTITQNPTPAAPLAINAPDLGGATNVGSNSGTIVTPPSTPNRAALALSADSATPQTLTIAPASTAPLSIRVMTYNLGLLKMADPLAIPDPTAKPGQGDIVPLVDERSAAAPALLAAYATERKLDVIGLEEVWRKVDQDRISSALVRAGYSVFTPNYKPPEASVIKGFFDLLTLGKSDNLSSDISALANIPLPKVTILTSGLLLAAGPRMKIRNAEFKGFREKGGFEVFADKGFITAEIEQPGARQPNVFTAVLAHFQAMSTSSDGVPYVPSEFNSFQAQQDQVRAVITRKTANGSPSILFGDMNSGPGYAEERFNRFSGEFGYRNAFFEANRGALDQKNMSWNQDNPLVKTGERSEEHSSIIDHVFLIGPNWKVDQGKIAFSENLVAQYSHRDYSQKIPLSDHYAVDVSLHLVAQGEQ